MDSDEKGGKLTADRDEHNEPMIAAMVMHDGTAVVRCRSHDSPSGSFNFSGPVGSFQSFQSLTLPTMLFSPTIALAASRRVDLLN